MSSALEGTCALIAVICLLFGTGLWKYRRICRLDDERCAEQARFRGRPQL